MHANYQLPLIATTDIRGTSSPQSLSLNVVRERALESRTDTIQDSDLLIVTIRYRYSQRRPGPDDSGFKLSGHNRTEHHRR